MKRFVQLAPLILTLGSLIISPSLTLKNSQTISSRARFNYAGKTVTWADGSMETIGIDSKGLIFLNGIEVQAFGFAAYAVTEDIPSETDANEMLDWLQNEGARFVRLNIRIDWPTQPKTRLDFWMPKFYAHKMFVLPLFLRDKSLDIPSFNSQFANYVDYIDANNWEDMIYAVGLTGDLDGAGYTDSQVETFLAGIVPTSKDKLVNGSNIGQVPVLIPTAHMWIPQAWKEEEDTHGLIPMMTYTDIPAPNGFYGRDDKPDDWLAVTVLPLFREDYLTAETGKQGYQIWIIENGYTKAGETGEAWRNNDNYPIEQLTSLLAESDVSTVMIWKMYNSEQNTGWGAFDFDGASRNWIENLASYFPI